MQPYTPTSRRPIAGLFRRTADPAVRFCVRTGIHPDTVSYASIVASLGAAICFVLASSSPVLLFIAPAFCYLRLWFNMLDGMVALASGKASLHGEIVNEFPDRISDILIFGSVALSSICRPDLAWLSAIAAVFIAYTGVLGQAVGVQREFSGVMSKPWRMVALHIGAWAMLAPGATTLPSPFATPLTAMDWTLILVLLGSIQTIYLRLRRILLALEKKKSEPAK